ncbi:hypothetical protein E2C01_052875 [Portunus trituberculatus]|uniref:Uncharacterized protein n=1 Tax=Portunus trituberculatus TaxID=210409 RepID=A0A5B7GN09_PORTR|nr:hypothetical protein [Portunus trituberculatus]
MITECEYIASSCRRTAQHNFHSTPSNKKRCLSTMQRHQAEPLSCLSSLNRKSHREEPLEQCTQPAVTPPQPPRVPTQYHEYHGTHVGHNISTYEVSES